MEGGGGRVHYGWPLSEVIDWALARVLRGRLGPAPLTNGRITFKDTNVHLRAEALKSLKKSMTLKVLELHNIAV